MQFAFHLLGVQESPVVDLLALVVVLLVDAVATGVHQVLVQVVVHEVLDVIATLVLTCHHLDLCPATGRVVFLMLLLVNAFVLVDVQLLKLLT